MTFHRERFLVRYAAAGIGAQLLKALLVMAAYLGGWSSKHKLCDAASIAGRESCRHFLSA